MQSSSNKFHTPNDQNQPASFDLQALINERAAASFLNVTPRFLQNRRTNGGGPPYVRISHRCVRYRKVDLILFAEEHLCRGGRNENA
jgi:hypothetical protein